MSMHKLSTIIVRNTDLLYLAVQQAIQFLPNIMVSRMVDKSFHT